MIRKLIHILISVCCCSTASCSALKPEPAPPHKETVVLRTTAYTSAESDHRKYGKRTATGTNLKSGVIATDWSVFPVGTKLKINDQIFTVEDFGSALVKRHKHPTVDVYVSSIIAVRKWGVKTVVAEVIEMGSFERSLALLKPRRKYKHCRIMHDRITTKYKHEEN